MEILMQKQASNQVFENQGLEVRLESLERVLPDGLIKATSI